MHVIPGLRLRYEDDEEVTGIDEAELAEFAYDYVKMDPNYEYNIQADPVDGTPGPGHQGNGAAGMPMNTLPTGRRDVQSPVTESSSEARRQLY
jgi:hypothetical protein